MSDNYIITLGLQTFSLSLPEWLRKEELDKMQCSIVEIWSFWLTKIAKNNLAKIARRQTFRRQQTKNTQENIQRVHILHTVHTQS